MANQLSQGIGISCYHPFNLKYKVFKLKFVKIADKCHRLEGRVWIAPMIVTTSSSAVKGQTSLLRAKTAPELVADNTDLESTPATRGGDLACKITLLIIYIT